MDQGLTVFFIGALILFALFVRGGSRGNEKKRTAEFVEISRDLSMSFSSKVDSSFRKELKPFKRFRTGRNGTFKNILLEDKNGVQVVFFECFQKNKAGSLHSSNRNVMEGIFYFSSPSLKLPRFTLHEAEELQQDFLGAFGVKDINFERYPVFSKKYLLNSDDTRAVREFFSDELIRFLETLNGINVEGCGDKMIIYRPDVRLETSRFKQFKQEAVQIFEQFR